MKHAFVTAVAVAGVIWTCAAMAASPTYVGRWADSADSCRNGEAITLTRREMHLLENGLCQFQKVGGGAGHWHTTMTCTGEGSTDRVSADLMVKGDTLTVIYGKPYNSTASFRRCGASGIAAAAVRPSPKPPSSDSSDTGSYRKKAMSFLTEDAADAKIDLDLVDLNGDRIPEGLAVVESPSECGSRGCAAYVLDLTGPRARSIGDFTAQTLKALPTKTGKWRDVSLNGIKMSFRGGVYKSAR